MNEIEFNFQLEFWHWLILAAALAGIEILTPGFFFIWLGGAALITAVVALMAPALTWENQVLIFALLSAVSVLGWYRFRHRLVIASDDKTLNRRGEQLLGRSATLSEPIVNGRGQIRIDDTVWRCEGEDLAAGTKVKVVAMHGAVVAVEKA
ncbi:NfeD family protein [Dongia sp.]|uniref:NfeD family protein n=1 Tax=Dongia sp. TaxID=1977262 RepID=UPI0035B48486